MSMSKKDFVALADALRPHLRPVVIVDKVVGFTREGAPMSDVVDALAAFCRSQNPRFNEHRWRDYLAGKCGPSGGTR